MRYLIEVKKGVAKETLVFNGRIYSRITKQTDFGSVSLDKDFSEQIERDVLSVSDDLLDQMNDVLDGFLVYNLLEIAESEEESEEEN